MFAGKAQVQPAVWIVFVLLIAVLIVGTLQASLLTTTWWSLHLPVDLPAGLVQALSNLSLTPQGAGFDSAH